MSAQPSYLHRLLAQQQQAQTGQPAAQAQPQQGNLNAILKPRSTSQQNLAQIAGQTSTDFGSQYDDRIMNPMNTWY
jgi:hypothetical protein